MVNHQLKVDELATSESADARPIAAFGDDRPIQATFIGKDEAGQLVYVKEVPLIERVKPRHAVDNAGHPHSWNRQEFVTPSQNGLIRNGWSLILSQRPLSSAVVAILTFKGAFKKSHAERPYPENMTNSTELVRWVDDLDFDPWEQGHDLVAGLLTPPIPFKRLDKVRTTRKKDNGGWCAGICPNFSEYENILLNSVQAQRLLEWTRRRNVKFGPSKVGLTRPYKEVADDRREILLLAIRQALAGPYKLNEDWTGQTVVRKMTSIYRRHLQNRNRVQAPKKEP